MRDIQQGCYFTWKFLLPKSYTSGWGETSPAFKLQTCKYHLRFTCNSHAGGWHYILSLQKPQETESFRPFTVVCFAEIKDTEALELRFTKFESSPEGAREIWSSKYTSISNHKHDFFDRDRTFTFVVVFKETSQDPTKGDKSIQANLITGLEDVCSDFGKLLASGEASDAQIKCGDVSRPVHKLVLSARSPVFSAMFRNKMKEEATGQVDMGDVDPGLLDTFLQYLYKGSIPEDCPDETYPDFYALGDKYAVLGLKRLCFDSMMDRLTKVNFTALLALVERHSDEEFKERVIESVTDHSEWLNCESWFEFTKTCSKVAIEVYKKFYEKTAFKKL